MNILEFYESNVKKYFNKGIFLDTGILLLLAVGMYDENQIQNYSITKSHTIEDFRLLKTILCDFKRIITTPNILTEVCDFICKLPNKISAEVLTAGLARYIETTEEKYIESSMLAKTDCYKYYGLADASILYSAKGNYFVLTEDKALWEFLKKNKIPAVNFNHVRFQR